MNETTLNGQSADIVSENIQKLKQIFPEVFCEDSIDFEKLQMVLGEYIDDKEDRYNFTWWGKSRALRLAQTPSMGTLRPCKEESRNWDTTQNLYIEGDNLEVLKLLQKSYHGKIKMIYIDPPYNTGNDFMYFDDFRKDSLQNELDEGFRDSDGNLQFSTGIFRKNSKDSAKFHTNWLNMMFPRLRLARNLLSEDGVILVSISDQEFSNLIFLMNELFGENNQIGIFLWKSRAKPTNAGNARFRPQKTGEYVVVYGRKPADELLFNVIPAKTRVYPHEDQDGKFRLTTILTSNRGTFRRETMRFEVGGFKPDDDYRWKAGKDIIEDLFSRNRIMFNDDGVPMEKKYENEEQEPLYPIYCFMDPELSGTAENGKSDLSAVIGNQHGFDTVKPVQLIKYFLATFTDESDMVLDFFAGSSTTAQAVFELNSEGDSQRKFILSQLPEEIDENSEAYKAGYRNICQIGKERIRRSGENIKAELQEKQNNQPSILEENISVHPDDLDIGFKVFKLGSSNLKKWNPDVENIGASLLDAIENYVDGRSELDVVYEIMLKYGIDLTLPLEEFEFGGKKIYSIGYGALMICLDREITTDVANEIVRLKEDLKPEVIRVVFKDNGFKDDSAKTNTKEILRNAGIDEIVSV